MGTGLQKEKCCGEIKLIEVVKLKNNNPPSKQEVRKGMNSSLQTVIVLVEQKCCDVSLSSLFVAHAMVVKNSRIESDSPAEPDVNIGGLYVVVKDWRCGGGRLSDEGRAASSITILVPWQKSTE